MKPAGRKSRSSEQPAGVPAWVVSFSDMVTLLLAFFILLQAFSKTRDPELFYIGQGSFNRAISGLGLPDVLFGKELRPRRQFRRLKYPTESTDQKRTKRTPLDAEDERIRKIFEDIRRAVETRSTDLAEKPINVFATPIRFRPGGWRLDAQAEAFCRDFAENLLESLGGRRISLYVIGLAADQKRKKDQWLVSARRAGSVHRRLARLLGAEVLKGNWSVSSWGAGPGGQWCTTFGLVPKHTFVVIAVAE